MCNLKTANAVLSDDLYQCMFTTKPDTWETVIVCFWVDSEVCLQMTYVDVLLTAAISGLYVNMARSY